MNTSFSFHRFGLLLRRQWLEFGRIFLITLVVLTGVIALFYGMNLHSNRYDNTEGVLYYEFRVPVFLILGFLFISIVASSYFASLGQKSKAIIELMIPASMFEKFMCGLFYTVIVTIGGYLLIFLVLDAAFMDYARGHVDPQVIADLKAHGLSPVIRSFFAELFRSDEHILRYTWPIPLLVVSVFLLGSVYFNRFHYIKTAVVAMIFIGLCVYVFSKTSDWLRAGKIRVVHPELSKPAHAFPVVALVFAAITLVFWLITYVRLKEKEV